MTIIDLFPQAMDEAGVDIPAPWTVEYDKYHNGSLVSEEISPGMMTEDKKLLGHCIPGCMNYEFDPSFWEATMITEWDLVCEKSWLKTLAKLLLFTGETVKSQYYHLISAMIMSLETKPPKIISISQSKYLTRQNFIMNELLTLHVFI